MIRSKCSGYFMSLARPGTTACPPNPANTNPTPPSQLPAFHSGVQLVGEGCRMDPGGEDLENPSMRRMRMSRRDERVDRREGRERRWRGSKVVGSTLGPRCQPHASC